MDTKKFQDIFKITAANASILNWTLLAGVVIIVAITLYSGIVVTEYQYQVGDIARRDIKASRFLLIENKELTKIRKKQAQDLVLTVYNHDTALCGNLIQGVEKAFLDLNAVIKKAGKRDETRPEIKTRHENIWSKKKEFEKKIGINVSNDEYEFFEKEKFSPKIAFHITTILKEILDNGVVDDKEALLKEDKGIVLISSATIDREIIDEGINTGAVKTEKNIKSLKKFYGVEQAKTMVRIIGQPILKDVGYSLLNLSVNIIQRLIRPNITLNAEETENRKKIAIANIDPFKEEIKPGEMILREGEKVTSVHLARLKAIAFESDKKQILIKWLGSLLLILCLLLIIYFVSSKYQRKNSVEASKDLFFIASIFIFFFVLAKISLFLTQSIGSSSIFPILPYFGTPIAAGAMIICIFIGIDTAIAFSVLMAVCVAIIFESRLEIFIYFLLNSFMGAFWIQTCRERRVFIKAGVKSGLLNLVLITSISFYIFDISIVKLLWYWIFAFSSGVIAGILTSGMAPLVELIFDYTTDIKLLELANLDRPILKRLLMEAPGTYHHSVIVGSLVEAAASEIGANPLLAKVCGYYHDIGKIKKPTYFIENQTIGKNPHNRLAPSMSSLILAAHIKGGVEIAKKYKLGRHIIDTIKQHHGTSLISFFYEKAKHQKSESSVNIDDFRYPGPSPQTKETGLVMMADVVEAASRSFENPTPSKIQGLVQRLINELFSEGQFEHCELTLKDLNNVAKTFNKVLNGIYHHRIEYPEQNFFRNGKDKNGSSDKQQTEQIQYKSKGNFAKNKGRLRRLGLSRC